MSDTLNTDLINLAIYHDGSDVATNYIKMIMEKFSKYFSKVLVVTEDEIENFEAFDNMEIISFLKPINNGCDWLMILEVGEIPSLQLIDNLVDILKKTDKDTNILFFPIVLCDYDTGNILKIFNPVSRIFRQKPQDNESGIEQVTLEDYPIIAFNINTELPQV